MQPIVSCSLVTQRIRAVLPEALVAVWPSGAVLVMQNSSCPMRATLFYGYALCTTEKAMAASRIIFSLLCSLLRSHIFSTLRHILLSGIEKKWKWHLNCPTFAKKKPPLKIQMFIFSPFLIWKLNTYFLHLFFSISFNLIPYSYSTTIWNIQQLSVSTKGKV